MLFLEVDEPWSLLDSKPPKYKTILSYICKPGISSNIPDIVNRYKEISREKTRLSIAPAEPNILEKLIWPLRNAKACYMSGNYLGAISLCGMVAEMVAVLLFEISDISVKEKNLDRVTQRNLFGSDFEKLGQERRVNILRAFQIIDDELKKYFDTIREKRRRYLHLYFQDYSRIAPDAIEVYLVAVNIVVKVIGQDIKEGKILLNPALVKYLHRKGATTFFEK